MSRTNPVRRGPTMLGVRWGLTLAALNAVLLLLVWFAGLADAAWAMSVFYLTMPAAIAAAALSHARSPGVPRLGGAVGAGMLTALIGGAGYGLAMAAVLVGLNGGEGPPLIAGRIAEVEAAAATAVGDVEAALERLRAQMDPGTHSIYAGFGHALAGALEAAFIAPMVWIITRPGAG